MTRQDRFEAYFTDSRGLEPGTMTQYRFNTQDGYRLPKLAMAYRDFCAGIGAVVVNLDICAAEVYDGSGNLDFTKVVLAIESAGAQVAP